jgi:membrane-associated protein
MDVRFQNRAYLARAHAFYEKHGGRTVVLGHFFPIIRTFVPFVAGMGAMTFPKFLRSNVLGVSLWVGLFLALGWFVGAIPYVQRQFGVVEILIVAISSIPAAVTFLKERTAGKARKAATRETVAEATKEEED